MYDRGMRWKSIELLELNMFARVKGWVLFHIRLNTFWHESIEIVDNFPQVHSSLLSPQSIFLFTAADRKKNFSMGKSIFLYLTHSTSRWKPKSHQSSSQRIAITQERCFSLLFHRPWLQRFSFLWRSKSRIHFLERKLMLDSVREEAKCDLQLWLSAHW